MFHWNTAALAEEIRSGSISEKDKMKYFLLSYVCMIVLSARIFEDGSKPLEWVDYATDFVSIAAATFGILYVFKQNGNRGSFLEKTICLSWPLTIKVVLAAVLFYTPLLFFGGAEALGKKSTDLLELVFITGLEIFFFVRLGYCERPGT